MRECGGKKRIFLRAKKRRTSTPAYFHTPVLLYSRTPVRCLYSLRPTIEVTAPSRLHFGLLSFGNTEGRQFGGVGVMIDTPGLKMRVSPAEKFEIVGPHAEKLRRMIWQGYYDATGQRLDEADGNDPFLRIEILHAPREHTGLGLGTQLGMAAVAALNEFWDWPTPDDEREEIYALISGRGKRSAVGVYGFCRGGLIAEAGKLPVEELSPLIERVELPSAWRFVVMIPQEQSGLAGAEESLAFDKLPPVPRTTTEMLTTELMETLLPAARAGDFAAFSESLYRYNRAAGECYAPLQGGPYASRWAEDTICFLRRLGIAGVGQSSWGPAVFALVANDAEATELTDKSRTRDFAESEIIVAGVDNAGGRVLRLANSNPT